MNKNIVIPNKKQLDEKIAKFKKEGSKKIHVLSDFDKTLTYFSVNKQKAPSIIFLLREGKYLAPGYSDKAFALYEEYHPDEIDLSKSYDFRKKRMDEWWSRHFQLLIESGLNKKDIENIAGDKRIKLRKGINKFLKKLDGENIPLLIISASGVGDSIKMILEKEKLNLQNIHVITNTYEFDEKDNAIKPKKPTIHSLNKSEVAIKDYPVFNKIKNRKNVLLLGDSIDDIGMIEGFDYNEIIKIGFLNEKTEEQKKDFERNFDIVILDDGNMGHVNDLLKNILEKK